MNINGFVPDSKIFDTFKTSQNSNSNETKDNGAMSFLDTLKSKLDEVNDDQIQADEATQSFIQGDNVDIHQVMIATEEAKMSLQMAVQVRNKLVEAFQELNRMQL
jgi:flagellar hook-basal body complex protein FliE